MPRASLPDSASSLGWSLCPLASPCESVSDFVYGSVSLSPDLFRRLSGPDVQLQLAHTCSPAASPPASVPARRITASRQLWAAGTGARLSGGWGLLPETQGDPGAWTPSDAGVQAPSPRLSPQTQGSRPPAPPCSDPAVQPHSPRLTLCLAPDRMPGVSMMLMLSRTWLGSWAHMNLGRGKGRVSAGRGRGRGHTRRETGTAQRATQVQGTEDLEVKRGIRTENRNYKRIRADAH